MVANLWLFMKASPYLKAQINRTHRLLFSLLKSLFSFVTNRSWFQSFLSPKPAGSESYWLSARLLPNDDVTASNFQKHSILGDGSTWLHLACQDLRVSLVDAFLVKGFDLNARNGVGDTPLMITCKCFPRSQEYNPSRNKRRVFKGVHSRLTGNRSIRSINSCRVIRRSRKETGIFNKGYQILNSLLLHGADVNVQANNGWTCLHVAAEKGDYHLIAYLLEHGADPKIIDTNGNTASCLVPLYLWDSMYLFYLVENNSNSPDAPIDDSSEKASRLVWNTLCKLKTAAKSNYGLHLKKVQSCRFANWILQLKVDAYWVPSQCCCPHPVNLIHYCWIHAYAEIFWLLVVASVLQNKPFSFQSLSIVQPNGWVIYGSESEIVPALFSVLYALEDLNIVEIEKKVSWFDNLLEALRENGCCIVNKEGEVQSKCSLNLNVFWHGKTLMQRICRF